MKIENILKATVLTLTVSCFSHSFVSASYASDEMDIDGGGGTGLVGVGTLQIKDLLMSQNPENSKLIFEEKKFEAKTTFTMQNTKLTFSFRIDPKEKKSIDYADITVISSSQDIVSEFEKVIWDTFLPTELWKPIDPKLDIDGFLKREGKLQDKFSNPFEEISYKLCMPLYETGVVTVSLVSEKIEEKKAHAKKFRSTNDFFWYLENWMQGAVMYKVSEEIIKESKKTGKKGNGMFN